MWSANYLLKKGLIWSYLPPGLRFFASANGSESAWGKVSFSSVPLMSVAFSSVSLVRVSFSRVSFNWEALIESFAAASSSPKAKPNWATHASRSTDAIATKLFISTLSFFPHVIRLKFKSCVGILQQKMFMSPGKNARQFLIQMGQGN